MSSSMMLPNPWHVGQAPNGLLNEKSRGCGASYAIPQVRHSNFSENSNRWDLGFGIWDLSSARTMANADPPPSRYEVSMESVNRLRMSPSKRMRSTTTSMV